MSLTLSTAGSNSQNIQSGLTSGMSITSTNVTFNPFLALSKEETEELDRLEEELAQWKKAQQILTFKELNKDLRQQIVDEAIARQAVDRMYKIDESKFPYAAEISSLRTKKYPYLTASYIEQPNWRFNKILNIFTCEELSLAHAEACLEEELNSSDSSKYT